MPSESGAVTENFKKYCLNSQKVSAVPGVGAERRTEFRDFASFFRLSMLPFNEPWCHGTVTLSPYRVEDLAAAIVAAGCQTVDRTTEAVTRQITAMGAAVYEVGLYKPEAEAEGEAVMIPRTWDVDSLMKSIKWLRLQNLEGRNIYVRPKGEHNLSLVDDLTADAVRRMKSAGFQPAAIVETSPGNFQAWLKHPRQLSRELSTAAARTLAADFGGDLGAADWRHFGRAGGFANRKPRYRRADGLYPFVRLREANGGEYPEGDRFLARVEARFRDAALKREQARANLPKGHAPAPIRDIESFRQNPTYAGDGTRIDLAYAIYALSRGSDSVQVEAALRSRSLAHKGSEKRQTEYIERTIKKALAIAGNERPSLIR